jgi:hypothetical protein
MPRTSNCPLFPARDVDLVFRGQSNNKPNLAVIPSIFSKLRVEINEKPPDNEVKRLISGECP